MHTGTFSKRFKISEVIPVYKKTEPYNKKLLTHPKFMRCMHDEINAYFDDILAMWHDILSMWLSQRQQRTALTFVYG